MSQNSILVLLKKYKKPKSAEEIKKIIKSNPYTPLRKLRNQNGIFSKKELRKGRPVYVYWVNKTFK